MFGVLYRIFPFRSDNWEAACFALICASNSTLRASAVSCTALYAEDRADASFDDSEDERESPWGPVVPVCASMARGRICLPFPDGRGAVASCRRALA